MAKKDVKTICPITKGTFPETCSMCSFCIQQDNKRVGCAIRKNVKELLNKKAVAKEINKSFIIFKDEIVDSINKVNQWL